MESMQSIKNRIQRVGSTKQITQAMHLVSSTKVQRARFRMDNARPYFENARDILKSIARTTGGIRHPYIHGHNTQGAAVFVIASDQGLCGGYNINVSKAAIDLIHKTDSSHIVAVGKRTSDYLHRRGIKVLYCFEGVMQAPLYDEARKISELALALFSSRQVGEIYLVYTEFHSMISYVPKAVRLLPLADEEAPAADMPFAFSATAMFEPAEDSFLNMAVPQYLSAYIYGAMTESAVCEQCARITSMDDAVKNSTELIDDLTLQYNRARQGAITQELSEIVGGYNALD